jgi:hypothetical protein
MTGMNYFDGESRPMKALISAAFFVMCCGWGFIALVAVGWVK